MARVINISDKLSNDKPKLQIGEKEYEVNDSMEVVLKFEELASVSTVDNMVKAIELALGQEAANELNIRKMPAKNFKTLTIAIMAAMQDMSFEDATARFQF